VVAFQKQRLGAAWIAAIVPAVPPPTTSTSTSVVISDCAASGTEAALTLEVDAAASPAPAIPKVVWWRKSLLSVSDSFSTVFFLFSALGEVRRR
jgi:hypothetical protein